jgi:hypothetical protein
VTILLYIYICVQLLHTVLYILLAVVKPIILKKEIVLKINSFSHKHDRDLLCFSFNTFAKGISGSSKIITRFRDT